MKSIVLLGCFDTKSAELGYVAKAINAFGLQPLTIDVSTGAGFLADTHFTNIDVAREMNVDWSDVVGTGQDKLLDLMAKGARSLIARLYRQGRIHGVFSCGGLQNTMIAAHAMQGLPIGVPKLILSTVASGQRTFETIVGASDIVTLPSITDFTGINPVSRAILDNATAALAGMVTHSGREIPKTETQLIGTTLMGATNDGVVNAISHLQSHGYEVVSFHSTGAGGRALEALIDRQVITAAMDLTLHEVVYEYFGCGFGYGAPGRLTAAIKAGIPLLVCPAGIDFMCRWKDAMFDDNQPRKVHWHNKTLAHVRLTQTEVTDIARIIIDRLNQACGPVKVVLPTKGFRNHTSPGEALYEPETDQMLVALFKQELRNDIPIYESQHNFMDPEFSKFMAERMMSMLQEAPNAQ